MCFLEFIGYTCGHTSLPVLRACPLTTASHTFPTCPCRADKPFLAGEMCSACQKIVHSRATQIEEYEHRFMHERGACGCDVVFPHLIRPRVIRGGDGGDSTSSTSDPSLPPLLREATDEGGRAVVSVRLPSLYAAEWVADHRGRHQAGLCHCRLDFRTYPQAVQELEAEAEAESAEVEVAEEDKPPAVMRPLRRTVSLSSMTIDEESSDGCGSVSLERSRSHRAFTYFMTDGAESSTDIEEKGAACENQQGKEVALPDGVHTPVTPSPRKKSSGFLTITGTDREESSPVAQTPPSVNSSTGCAATPIHVGTPVRYAGAVFAEVPAYLPLTGPFLAQPSPFAADLDQATVVDGVLVLPDGEEKKERGHQVQEWWTPPALSSPGLAPQRSPAEATIELKANHIQRAKQQVPLVGFPIGAGPEGASHALPWCRRPPCWTKP